MGKKSPKAAGKGAKATQQAPVDRVVQVNTPKIVPLGQNCPSWDFSHFENNFRSKNPPQSSATRPTGTQIKLQEALSASPSSLPPKPSPKVVKKRTWKISRFFQGAKKFFSQKMPSARQKSSPQGATIRPQAALPASSTRPNPLPASPASPSSGLSRGKIFQKSPNLNPVHYTTQYLKFVSRRYVETTIGEDEFDGAESLKWVLVMSP